MRSRLQVLAIVVFSGFASTTQAQWVQTNGPYGGNHIRCFALSQALGGAGSPTLFAGGLEDTEFGPFGEGVYRSTDQGMSWSPVNVGLASTSVAALALSGTHLLAGTYYGGVFLSTDNGTTWAASNTGLQEFETVRAFAMSGSCVFAGTSRGVVVSTNSGATWSSPDTIRALTNVSALVVSGPDLIAGTYYTGIFRSTNGGKSWTGVNGIPSKAGGWHGSTYDPVFALAVSSAGAGAGGMDLFAGLSGGVFRSTDSGATWFQANEGLPANAGVYALTVSDTSLFAGTGHGVFLSTDNGTTWSAVDKGASGPYWVTALVVSIDGAGGTNLFAGTQGDGVFRSTDNGKSWSETNTGMIGTSVVALGAAPPSDGSRGLPGSASRRDLFAGTYFRGVFRSTDDGASWELSSNGVPRARYDTTRLSMVNSFSCSGSNLFAATYDGILRCTDSGTRWTAVGSSGLPGDFSISAFVAVPNAIGGTDLLAGIAHGSTWTGEGVYHSTNRGESWTTSNRGLPAESYINAFAANGVDVFAASGGGIFMTTNSGGSWTAMSTGLPLNPRVSHLAMGGSTLFAGTYDGDLYVSTDNGASWVATVSRIPTNSMIVFIDLEVVPNGSGGMNLFVSTQNDGLFLSTDIGTSWTSFNDGLPLTWVPEIMVSGDYIFAGTYHYGVWRRPLSEMVTGVKGRRNEVPSRFALDQNFPNPFNPSTTIRYGLPVRSNVTLTVFNTLGQRVATLVNGEMEAGSHEAKFEASDLAGGVYLYRLTAGSYVETRKLVLVR